MRPSDGMTDSLDTSMYEYTLNTLQSWSVPVLLPIEYFSPGFDYNLLQYRYIGYCSTLDSLE